MDHGFQFGSDLRSQGSSVVTIPIQFYRPLVGSEILIPAPLLSYTVRRNPDGSAPSAMWNSSRNEWQERSTPGLNWLSVQLPKDILPLVVRQIRIALKVTGPIGRIEILGKKNGSEVSLKVVTDPVGTITIELTDPETLVIDEEGRLSLGVSAAIPSVPN